MDICPQDYIKNTYDLQASTPELILSMKHKFTHFHLHITALKIQVSALSQSLHEQQGQWLEASQTHSLGLAKPTQQILASILEISTDPIPSDVNSYYDKEKT